MQPPVVAKLSIRPRQVDTTSCTEAGKKTIMHVKAERISKVSAHGNTHDVMLLTSL